MDLFLKTIAAILVSAVLILTLGKETTAMLLTAAVCIMSAAVAVSYLAPVKDLLQELQNLADMQDGLMGILLKCAGTALISEIAGHICQDAGLGSLQKAVQFLGSSVILWLSIPAFQSLLTLLRDLLNEI